MADSKSRLSSGGTMIDYLTVRVRCDHRRPLHLVERLRVDRTTGGILSKVPEFVAASSHHGKLLHVRTLEADGQSYVEWSGSPASYLQEHNYFGAADLVGLVSVLMERLTASYDLVPTPEQREAWRRGDFSLTRVDLTRMVDMRPFCPPATWLRLAGGSLRTRLKHREIHEGTGFTLGRGRSRWQFVAYDKSAKVDNSDCGCPDERDRLRDYARDTVRLEVRLHRQELRARELDRGEAWRSVDVDELFGDYTRRLGGGEVGLLQEQAILGLTRPEQRLYTSWRHGAEPLRSYSPATQRKYRKRFLELGIDLTAPPPRELVPLRAVLDAPGKAIPDWAVGTDLLVIPTI